MGNMQLVSLDKPFKEGSNFGLTDVIAVKPDAYATSSIQARVKIKQARRSIEIDQDVVDKLRGQFGTMSLGRALRLLVGLQPKIAQNAWQEEEDELIRKYYPEHGSKHLAEILGRKPHCIRDRTSKLGIHRRWLYKRDRRGQRR